MEEKKEEIKKEEAKFEKVEPSKAKKEKKQKEKKEKVKGKTTTEGKKSNKVPVIIISIVVIILIIIAIYFIFIQSTPTKTIEGILQALKNSDYEKVNEYINYDELMSSSGTVDVNEEAQKLLFDKLSWNITETKKEEDTALVTVEVTNKNFKTIINNTMQEVLKRAFTGEQTTDQDTQNYLMEELRKEDVEMTTTTQNINLVKQDGKWIITTTNEELINMILPGLTEAINALN